MKPSLYIRQQRVWDDSCVLFISEVLKVAKIKTRKNKLPLRKHITCCGLYANALMKTLVT